MIYANFGAQKSQNNEIFGEEKGGRRGTEAPPDPPILADAKGGRRTEGRERADDTIVLKKKKEATQGTKGKEKRADDTIVLKKKKGKKESIVKESIVKESIVKKRIADSIGTKNIKFHFIGRKTPENLHMCKKKCNFARFLWAKDELVDEINN